MNTANIPGKCPLCAGGSLTPLALDYRVSVAKYGQQQSIGGLLAYMCAQRGHVFFVMAKDVQNFHEFAGQQDAV